VEREGGRGYKRDGKQFRDRRVGEGGKKESTIYPQWRQTEMGKEGGREEREKKSLRLTEEI